MLICDQSLICPLLQCKVHRLMPVNYILLFKGEIRTEETNLTEERLELSGEPCLNHSILKYLF